MKRLPSYIGITFMKIAVKRLPVPSIIPEIAPTASKPLLVL